MEIERKYLVKSLPDHLDTYPHVEIEQGYLCTSPTLRIRRAGDVFWLTIKENIHSESIAIQNREEEFRLTADRYTHLRTKCDGQMVSKTRYRIPLDGVLVAELDVFHGAHIGLLLVEVEFPSLEAADAFIAPVWFGQDVSQDPHYRNSWLAFHM